MAKPVIGRIDYQYSVRNGFREMQLDLMFDSGEDLESLLTEFNVLGKVIKTNLNCKGTDDVIIDSANNTFSGSRSFDGVIGGRCKLRYSLQKPFPYEVQMAVNTATLQQAAESMKTGIPPGLTDKESIEGSLIRKKVTVMLLTDKRNPDFLKIYDYVIGNYALIEAARKTAKQIAYLRDNEKRLTSENLLQGKHPQLLATDPLRDNSFATKVR